MPPRKTQARVRFVKEYTNWRGDRMRCYATADGRRATDVCIRRGRRGKIEMTSAEAKRAATWRLTAKPGSVRFIRRWTNDFTGLTFDDYENTDGGQETVAVRPGGFLSRSRNRTRAETRAEAVRKLGRR